MRGKGTKDQKAALVVKVIKFFVDIIDYKNIVILERRGDSQKNPA